jgi:predicted nucleic acid-binding Zn ribbon protein
MKECEEMPKNRRKKDDFIFLYSKKVKITKLVESFTVIPSNEIIKYLKNKEIYLPSYLHKSLIRKNIAPAIANADSSNKFSDEMKIRLRYFDQFTIFQLERLASGYQLPINVTEYKKDFWDIIIRNRTELGINNLEFVKLQNLTLKYARNEQETYEEMMKHFNEVYFEPEGYFDGTLIEEAKEVLNQATTLTEIRDLGKLYQVEIPRRINKKQLIDIVSLKLKLDDEKREEISKKSILEIERYAKRRKVNVSIELRKSDMIEYILIKMPDKEAPMYTNSLKVFAGMNIEEYLYNLKFEEIAEKIAEKKRARNKKIMLYGGLLVIVLGVVGALYMTGILAL